jgi:hypothetical protein
MKGPVIRTAPRPRRSNGETPRALDSLPPAQTAPLPDPPVRIGRREVSNGALRFVGSIKKDLDPTIRPLWRRQSRKIQLAVPPNPSDQCDDREGVVNSP